MMNEASKKTNELIAQEAFIRRASSINAEFMLKGSFITRQYFPSPKDRIPADLDWVYLNRLSELDDARQTFDRWAIEVTELELNDGVKFRSFKENNFWRMIDYAMADDFPTINTDIRCWIGEEMVDFTMDVSFNLDIDYLPESLYYQPLQGEPFTVPRTAPLSLQVSWKIHQTLVRPRFKDIFDLTFLVQHPQFNESVLKDALQALVNECSADNVDLSTFRFFLTGDFEKLFPNNSLKTTWNYWRHDIHEKGNYSIFYDSAEEITDVLVLPESLADFITNFKTTLEYAGLTEDLMNSLPVSTRKKNNVENSEETPNTNNTPSPQAPEPGSISLFDRLRKFFD
ncbi:MAG: hypothetical protein IT236_03135 [Bacteroidia bacterium]|nr:hypothetical protein [Bacteroidia bacterium]